MALSVTPQASPLGANLVQDDNNAGTTATPVLNATGAPGSIYMVDIDNAAGAAEVYLKIYDDAAPTVGVTAANWVFRCGVGIRRSCVIPEGYAFANALSFATVIEADQTGTTSSPTDVIIRIVTS